MQLRRRERRTTDEARQKAELVLFPIALFLVLLIGLIELLLLQCLLLSARGLLGRDTLEVGILLGGAEVLQLRRRLESGICAKLSTLQIELCGSQTVCFVGFLRFQRLLCTKVLNAKSCLKVLLTSLHTSCTVALVLSLSVFVSGLKTFGLNVRQVGSQL